MRLQPKNTIDLTYHEKEKLSCQPKTMHFGTVAVKWGHMTQMCISVVIMGIETS